MRKTLENIDSVWKEYRESRSRDLKSKLIMNYVWLVKYVLQQMKIPTHSLLEDQDYLNIGILGLNEAIERFDLEKGVKFETYGIARIKGTIRDELRRLDWLSRTARKKAMDYLQTGDELRSQMGREVSSEEIMKKLGVTSEEYRGYLQAASAAKASIYLSETSQAQLAEDDRDNIEELPDAEAELTLDRLENEERIDFIVDYVKTLKERKRLVVTLYYYENLTFKEIGKILEVSESRICQIHGQIVGDLRKKLQEFDNA